MIIIWSYNKEALKNYNCLKCKADRFFSEFSSAAGRFMFLCYFSAVARFFSSLDADCVFRYLVTLHERFIYLDMKLLPKRK